MTFKLPNDNKLVDESGKYLPQYRGAFEVIEALSKLGRPQINSLLKFVEGFGNAETGAIPVSEGDKWSSIPLGAIGSFLTIGDDNKPSWGDSDVSGPIGGLSFIDEIDMTGSTTKSISLFPYDYENHLVVFTQCGGPADTLVNIMFKVGGANATLSRGAIQIQSGTGILGTGITGIETAIGFNNASSTVTGAMLLLGANSTRYKTFASYLVNASVSPGASRVVFGTVEATSAIDSYDFRLDSTAWTSGTATLYGFNFS